MLNLKSTFFFGLCLLSSESFASRREAMEVAMKDTVVEANVPEINRVDIVHAYHCPDCFDVQVSGNDDQSQVAVLLRTESDGSGNFTVHLIAVTRH